MCVCCVCVKDCTTEDVEGRLIGICGEDLCSCVPATCKEEPLASKRRQQKACTHGGEELFCVYHLLGLAQGPNQQASPLMPAGMHLFVCVYVCV